MDTCFHISRRIEVLYVCTQLWQDQLVRVSWYAGIGRLVGQIFSHSMFSAFLKRLVVITCVSHRERGPGRYIHITRCISGRACVLITVLWYNAVRSLTDTTNGIHPLEPRLYFSKESYISKCLHVILLVHSLTIVHTHSQYIDRHSGWITNCMISLSFSALPPSILRH